MRRIPFPRGLPSNKTSCAGLTPLTDGLWRLGQGLRRMFGKRPVLVFCSLPRLFGPGEAELLAPGRGGASERTWAGLWKRGQEQESRRAVPEL